VAPEILRPLRHARWMNPAFLNVAPEKGATSRSAFAFRSAPGYPEDRPWRSRYPAGCFRHGDVLRYVSVLCIRLPYNRHGSGSTGRPGFGLKRSQARSDMAAMLSAIPATSCKWPISLR